jgi:hypothetical protein
MQNLTYLLFILFLSLQLNSSYACGPYMPGGEDYRFYMLNTAVFVGNAFDGLDYNLREVGRIKHTENAEYSGYSQNIKLWQKYANSSVKLEDIEAVIYKNANLDEFESSNSFVRFLQENEKSEAIEYIKFAKAASAYNTMDSPHSYWEEEKDQAWGKEQYRYYQSALRMITEVKDKKLQKRYAFLAMRLAFYVGEMPKIAELYEQYFAKVTERNILDYWALHFYTRTLKDPVQKAYYASLVFNGAPGKRYVSLRQFRLVNEVTKILPLAKDDEERAAIWLLAGVRKNGPALDCIQKVYGHHPQHPELDFLVYREIAKLEDWLLTPYYVGYQSQKEKDFAYAKELLTFVNSMDFNQLKNPLAFYTAQAYLQMMTADYKSALKGFKKAYKLAKGNHEAEQQIRLLQFLTEVKQKPLSKVKIPRKYRKLLMETVGQTKDQRYWWVEGGQYDRKLVFAIARELEFSGNTTLAAILMSKVPAASYIHTNKYRSAFWSFYATYEPYLDMEYSPQQMWDLTTHIRKAKAKKGFDLWFYSQVKKDLDHLEDIMGSKYIRRNKLDSALIAFEMVDDSVWQEERYVYYLEANPFYTNLYKEHGTYRAYDTMRYNKESLTAQLIAYLKMAEDETHPKRDYYALLVGNCYFNMTQYGNSWIMRRAGWSTMQLDYNLVDDDEFYGCKLAEKYYLQAAETAKTEDFKLAAMAMAARARSYRMRYENRDKMPYRWKREEYARFIDSLEQSNPHLLKAKALNAEDLEELRGSCYAFDEYLKAREAL